VYRSKHDLGIRRKLVMKGVVVLKQFADHGAMVSAAAGPPDGLQAAAGEKARPSPRSPAHRMSSSPPFAASCSSFCAMGEIDELNAPGRLR